MSTIIFTKDAKKYTDRHGTIFTMKGNGPISLKDYLQKVMNEKGLIASQVATISKRKGGDIERSYINRLYNGEAANPTIDKLKSLALGLGVPEDEIFDVARGKLREEELTYNVEVLQSVDSNFVLLSKDQQDFWLKYFQVADRLIAKEIEEDNHNRVAR